MIHWYRPTKHHGRLEVFDKGVDSRVQWIVNSVTFGTGAPLVLALMFSLGLSDGARDGSRMKWTTREPKLMALIVLYKCLIFFISMEGTAVPGRHPKIKIHDPKNLVCYLYFLLEYRLVTFLGQQLSWIFSRTYNVRKIHKTYALTASRINTTTRPNTTVRLATIAGLILVQFLWNGSTKTHPVKNNWPSYVNVPLNILFANGAFIREKFATNSWGTFYVYAVETSANLRSSVTFQCRNFLVFWFSDFLIFFFQSISFQ